MLDLLSCTAPHSAPDATLLLSSLSSLIPPITTAPSPVVCAWLRLLHALCAHPTSCNQAARGGALLLPVRVAQSGSADEILPALKAIHALAAGLLSPKDADAAVAAAAASDDCMLCSSGTLQAMSFIMRSSSDPTYLTLAASVLLLQCRHVGPPPPPLCPPTAADLRSFHRAVAAAMLLGSFQSELPALL
jgi:hypothetical protein